MGKKAIFEKAFPYGDDTQYFAMVEVERRLAPPPTVIMKRDDVRIGFSVNGGFHQPIAT